MSSISSVSPVPVSSGVRAAQLALAGRIVFGLPMIIFGYQHFLYARFVVTLMQPWMPARLFLTYLVGVLLIAAGAAIVSGVMTRLAAFLLGVMIGLFVLFVHTPQIVVTPGDPSQWTYWTQAFTFAGLAFVLSGIAAPGRAAPAWPDDALVAQALRIGRWMLAIGFAVLGVRQLLGVPFVIGLVPNWPPGAAIWALLPAVCLIATAIAITLRREHGPALGLAGVLCLFLLLYHVPRLAADPVGGDWGPFCKNAILTGGALILASAAARRR